MHQHVTGTAPVDELVIIPVVINSDVAANKNSIILDGPIILSNTPPGIAAGSMNAKKTNLNP